MDTPRHPPRHPDRPLPRTFRTALLALATVLAIAPATPAPGFDVEEKATVEVAADRTAYEPGATVRIATRVTIEDHWHVNSNTPSYDWLIPTVLTLEGTPPGSSEPELRYPPQKMQKFAFTEEPIAVYDGTVTIFAELELPEGVEPGAVPVTAALRYQACDDQQCLPPVTTRASLELRIGDGGEPANAGWFEIEGDGDGGGDDGAAGAAPGTGGPSGAGGGAGAGGGSSATGAGSAPGLPLILFLALLGGFILNAMPCVLPVLSLKIFGLVKSAGQGRSHLVVGTLATTAGIVASFWALALAAILAQRAGTVVGWGIQFQQPGFVAFLAVVVVLFSLNMWGLFEIHLPGALARAASGQPREGIAGHFASGLFATLMATPCSAPFLGTAVGFALAQKPPVIFAIFTAIGVGLALPYLLIAAVPATVRLLPKPGPWMVSLRQLMGFLLAAAAVWLFYVLAAQISPEQLAFFQLALLGLALATWLFRQAQGRPVGRKVAGVGMLAAAVLSVALVAGAGPAPDASAAPEKPGRIAWVPFDESQAHALAADGNLVFVDVTADWCLTCKTNERLVLETEEVAAAFEAHGVVPMKADWTNRDDEIADFLARFGRSSIPFYVLYRPEREPHPFGVLLTKGQILDALEESSQLADAAGGGVGEPAGSR